MALSEMQTTLIGYLNYRGIEKDQIIGTMIALHTEEDVEEMLSYLAENPEASESEIMLQLYEIIKDSDWGEVVELEDE